MGGSGVKSPDSSGPFGPAGSGSAPLRTGSASTLPIALAVFAAGVALYARTTGYDFLNWDDEVYVVDNPWVHGASGEGLRAIFSRGILGGWLPVHLLSYVFDHALWGLDPRGYHLHSVLLNGLNGALAYLLLLGLARRPAIAVSAALLFALHPSHVSSVAWISARKELLFTAFGLLSMLCYLRYLRAEPGAPTARRAWAASLVFFALGMLSKTTLAPYAAFLLLLDRWLDARRPLRAQLVGKLPFVAVAAAAVAANLATQVVSEHAGAEGGLGYALAKGQAAWHYLAALAGLVPGQPLHDAPSPLPAGTPGALAALAPLLALPLAAAAAHWRGPRDAALALAWLALGLLPPLVFPLVVFAADRYLYAPSLGFCWLLAAVFAAAAERALRPGAAQRVGIALATALCAAAFVPRAWAYTPVWRDSESLWTRGVETSRDPRARVGLSDVWIGERRFAEARALLAGLPDPTPKGELNRAAASLGMGQLNEALGAAERALAGLPAAGAASAQAHTLRGQALWKLGREAEALEAWRDALRADPDAFQARALLAELGRG